MTSVATASFHRAFEREDYAAAAQRYADPAWRAAARYRAGDYAAAARELDGRQDPESLYNRGNALARQGRCDEALAAYDAALQAQPAHDDAKYNKALIEDLLRRQQSPHRPGGGRGPEAQLHLFRPGSPA